MVRLWYLEQFEKEIPNVVFRIFQIQKDCNVITTIIKEEVNAQTGTPNKRSNWRRTFTRILVPAKKYEVSNISFKRVFIDKIIGFEDSLPFIKKDIQK